MGISKGGGVIVLAPILSKYTCTANRFQAGTHCFLRMVSSPLCCAIFHCSGSQLSGSSSDLILTMRSAIVTTTQVLFMGICFPVSRLTIPASIMALNSSRDKFIVKSHGSLAPRSRQRISSSSMASKMGFWDISAQCYHTIVTPAIGPMLTSMIIYSSDHSVSDLLRASLVHLDPEL